MGLEINRPLYVGGITSNINTVRYRGLAAPDTFEITSNKRYTTEPAVKKMIDRKVINIVKCFNPQLKLNMKGLENLLENHCANTEITANGIIENLPFSLRIKVDKKAVDDACYLHDLGKVLIPENILNKPDKLNEAETEIMHKHSELSYELLKNTDIDKKTLKLIRNHHQNIKKTGYPRVGNDFNADLNLQILSTADKYSALTEKRPYKDAMSPKQALTVIYQDVKEGKLHPFIFKALADYEASTRVDAKYQFCPN